MSFMSRVATAFGIARDAGLLDKPVAGTARAPRRSLTDAWVSPARALTLSTVFRAVQIHATSVSQLSLDVKRNGATIDTPALIEKPSLAMTRSAFLEEATTCLYLDGNAFFRVVRAGTGSTHAGEVVDLEILDPRLVGVSRHPQTGRIRFTYGQTEYTDREVLHLKYMRITGVDRGLGPIQAAQVELAGALDARDYGSKWFTEAGMPSGILKTDSALSPDQAKQYKNAWKGLDEDGEPLEGFTTHDVRVLGQGLDYAPLLLKPADVQFLESQQFTTTQIARLLGIPASLLLAAVEGNSQTYSNVEQDWIAYVRFSLMNVLREIEEALTSVIPRGQTARFNIDALLRSDTKTRYEGHNLALSGGWKTVDEIRSIENLPALTDDQRAEIAANKKPAAIAAVTPKEIPVA